MTPEFKEQFQSKYGIWGRGSPDYTRCAASVPDGGRSVGSHQCRRKNGHGPHGAWCKTHDPVARKAKSDARYAEYMANRAAMNAKHWLSVAAIAAIREIAAGCNDARGRAQKILDEYEERNGT